MTFWWWFLVFGVIALGGLGVLAMLGLTLWRKTKVLLAELARLSATVATLEATLGPAGTATEPAWVPEPVAISRHRAG